MKTFRIPSIENRTGRVPAGRLWLELALLLLAVAPPAVAEQYGDFTYTINGGKATITGYTDLGGVVDIPDSIGGNPVTRIGDSAFANCTGVTGATIPDTVTYVGNNAFYGCAALAVVELGNHVTYLGNYAFGGCGNLAGVTLPDSITAVGNHVFDSCDSLAGVTIGTGLTSIGSNAFDGCSGLTAFTVAAGNPTYSSTGGVLFYQDHKTLVECPEGKTGSYTIPNGVVTIGSYAFAGCSGLSSVTVPASVTLVSGYAFAGCTGLAGVYFKGNVPSAGSAVFLSDSNTVYYVAGTSGWGATFAGRPAVVWDATIMVTFNAGSVTVTPTSKSVVLGEAYGTLPTPVRAGYTFAGWWTGANGTGALVTSATVVTNPSSHTLYAAWTKNVEKSDQTITFPALPAKTYGDADFAPGATASSGLAVTYTSSNAAVATIIDGKIHIIGAGTTAITASQSGNETWLAATPVTNTLTVQRRKQSITFPALPAKTYGDADFAPGATASSVLAVTYTSSNAAVATIVDGNIHIVGVGTTAITASQPGNETWLAATPVTNTLTVQRRKQSITFPALLAKTYGDANFAPGATASSGLAVTYTSSNVAVATIVAGKIHIVGAGTAAITASQPGNETWLAATPVTKTLTVKQKTLTVTAGPATRSFGAANPEFTITYMGWVSADSVADLDTAPTAKCAATAASRAGTYPITVSGGTDGNYVFSYLTGVLSVMAIPPTVTTAVPLVTGNTSATVGGQVASDGGVTVTARGVCWSTSSLPTVADAKAGNGPGTGAFTDKLTGLNQGATYYVRAYATNAAGTAYGASQSFTTLALPDGVVDLVVASISMTPELPAAGDRFTVTITVLNQGSKSGRAGTVSVWADKPAAAAVRDTADKTALIGILQPAQAKTVRFSLPAPAALGTFTLRAFVDATGITEEVDENNNQNTLAYHTGRPDFTVSAFQTSPEKPVAGKSFTAYVTVTNSGTVAGDAGYLDVWADSSSLSVLPVPGPTVKGNKYKLVGTLQPGQEKTITVTGLRAPLANPTPTLGVLIDSRAKTVETDEDNNGAEFDYECE